MSDNNMRRLGITQHRGVIDPKWQIETGDEPQLGGKSEDNSPMLSNALHFCKRCKRRVGNDEVLHSITLANVTMVNCLCDSCYDWFQQYVAAALNAELTMGEPVRTENGISITMTARVRVPPG